MPRVRITGAQQRVLRDNQENIIAYRKRLERERNLHRAPYIDDRLYPADQGAIILGSYRGRKKRIFKPREHKAGECVRRALVSTPNGWHCVTVTVDGVEVYRSPSTRDREAAKALLATS